MRILQPDRDCPRCPRLVASRATLRDEHPEWFNAPVPSFGPLTASLLVVGLAPGRAGANRTGRPFTGDAAGAVLYPALAKVGFAVGRYAASPDDGLRLVGCRITNAVRCVPPENKPTAQEIANCSGFLRSEIAAMPHLRIILALGRVAHRAVHIVLQLPEKDRPFAHGALYPIDSSRVLADSYHSSRQNVATGRLTAGMLEQVLVAIRRRLD
jgi:uracil-DNA glycosylase